MTTGLRITEVARRSGFTPATLRYYEKIGLLPAAARTGSGYRAYEDATFDRLAFITRAKQLGCTLEEITDLVVAWEGGECGPIQDRLRRLVASKLAEAQQRTVELVAFTAELHQAAATLEGHCPTGPCDDRCGCTTPGAGALPVALAAKPADASEPPIACTLEADAMSGRLEDWNELLRHVSSRSAIPGGVRLELGPLVPLGEMVRLAAAEQDCCRFFAFAVTIDDRGVGLEVRASEDGLPVIHAVFGVPG